MQEEQYKSRPSNPAAQPDEQLVSTVTAVIQALQGDQDHSGQKYSKRAESEQPVKTIDLVGLLFHILQRFWIVVLSAILFAGLMGYNASLAVPTYSATSKLYIVNPNSTGINLTDLQLGTVLTLDYQEVFRTWEVHEMVREELNLPYSYNQMQSMITVTNPEDTRLLYITATYTDAQMAADIANAYARAAKEFIISTMKGEEPSDFSIALVPGRAQVVSRSRSVVMGFMLGSVLVVGLLTLLFVLDERPRTPEDISDVAGIPTLAVLPSAKDREHANRKEEKQRRARRKQ